MKSSLHFYMCFTFSLLFLICGLLPQKVGHCRIPDVAIFLLQILIEMNLTLRGVIHCFEETISICCPQFELFCKHFHLMPTKPSSKIPQREVFQSHPQFYILSKVISYQNIFHDNHWDQVRLEMFLFIKQAAQAMPQSHAFFIWGDCTSSVCHLTLVPTEEYVAMLKAANLTTK